ncbi:MULTISPECIES: ABC transporter substrate-binding protein [unclassified Pseudofrankia]|uniref:ABC transporter substrate-binding protein n=1 Tax=unclassified Pseudofrankia TaxID=2994372 RepID=UPI0008DA97BB|nr:MULTISPECIES: ABC transporter substrate-binding protein [unclassified Pseudofrankia]MDT3439954.1 ABC transporter substrate-binding protein [Pseudofrankia sp. BMG5.37]OHV48417.1 hypothetical protein BCD48_15675 [Pseudofrankia sp. BMG5.36]
MPFPSNLQALAKLLGGSLGSSGAAPPTDEETKAYYQALADYVNNHGGLLGRKIQPVFYPLDATRAAGDSSEQEMCTQFTQDHHVFAVMDLPNHSDTIVSCLQSANVIAFDAAGGSLAADDTYFQQRPLYATAGALSLTRAAALQVNGLFQGGFFGQNPKIGLVGYNTDPFTRAIDESLKPALASHGLTITDQQLVKPVSGVNDIGPTQQAISSAVLRFKQQGIDHVLFLDTQGGTLRPFTQAASTQKYFPKLGFTTNELPAQRAYAGNKTDPDQEVRYANSMAVGWYPSADAVNPPVNATGALCNKIMEASGASPSQAQFFWNMCDQLLVFTAGVNAGGKLTPQDAITGLGKAKNIPSAELLGPPDYSGGRRDGVTIAKLLKYTPSCTCFQYSGGPLPASAFTTTS